MEWIDILRRIKDGEGRHTEFKTGAGDLKNIGRAICGFANTEGGVLILGVDDSGTILGVKEDATKLQERPLHGNERKNMSVMNLICARITGMRQ